MTKYLIISFFITLLSSVRVFCQNESIDLIRKNKVSILYTYSSQIGKIKKSKKILIASKKYNHDGKILKETYFDKFGEIDRIIEYSYQLDGIIDSIFYTNKNDATIRTKIDSIRPVNIITGGIPDYFPKEEYYQNGLMKSETAILGDGKEVLFEYIYEYY